MYVVIVGCGRVGAELAKLLSQEGHDVVVIDQRGSAFARLGAGFNGVIVRGSGVSTKTLQEAGITKAQIFCSLTNSDNINIMASQVAKGIFKVPRVIVRVYDPSKAAIYKALGFDILSETTLFASMIRDKITDPLFSGYLIETRELGVLEFPVPSHLFGKKVEEMNIPQECVVAAIRRHRGLPVIPDNKMLLGRGDVLLVVVKIGSVEKVKKIFNLT